METVQNLALPGNPRYQPKSLQSIFGYDNLYTPVGEVEIAALQTLGEIGVIPKEDMALLTPEIIERILAITTTEVDQVEREITKHDIRAWVRIAQEIIPASLRRWVHVPLTSYDPLDTARSLQFQRAYSLVVRPKTDLLIEIMAEIVRGSAYQVQIGRTHGQHALPITVGFWLATILNRILYCREQMDRYASGLVGKISGAVGAYNAQVGLGINNLCGEESFEKRVLSKLGLEPALISTQILPPEPLAFFLFSVLEISATLAQLGRDCRHLMRSEIGELSEPFEDKQVGSSTMAHKRNPISFENLEGMYIKNMAEFLKVMMVQISEHQRDLVGSSVARDFPIIIVNLVKQLDTLLQGKKDGAGKTISGSEFIRRIKIDQTNLDRNFEQGAKFTLAEPLYIALQMADYEGDAHELVNRQAMSTAQKKGVSLWNAMWLIADDNEGVHRALQRIPDEVKQFLRKPEEYTGFAANKAIAIAHLADGKYLEIEV